MVQSKIDSAVEELNTKMNMIVKKVDNKPMIKRLDSIEERLEGDLFSQNIIQSPIRESALDNKDTTSLRKISTERWSNEASLKNHRLFLQSKVDTGRKLRRVCLTGGPCAGKSSALSHVKQALEYENIHVIIVPEASTLL